MKAIWLSRLPGISLCFCLALLCQSLGNLVPLVGSAVFGILLGILCSPYFHTKNRYQAGIAFTSKKILQTAVVLLGFGLNFSVVLQIGRESLPVILCTIATSLLLSYLLWRILHLPSNTAILVGVGSSICGGSAIAATAPVIGANDTEVAQSISVVFLFNVIAALLFPMLGQWLGFEGSEAFGLFVGTAVNDTSSVTATASTWDSLHHLGTATLDRAVTVKLTRTLAILPITLALAFFRSRKAGENGHKVSLWKIFPKFILYFLAASLLTSLISFLELPPWYFAPVKATCKLCSKFFIVMAMVAIGLNTDVPKLFRSGGSAILLGFCCWTGISLVSLLLIG